MSRALRIVALVDGAQLEITLITETQWHFGNRDCLKVNSSLGLTQNATEWVPETGVVLVF